MYKALFMKFLSGKPFMGTLRIIGSNETKEFGSGTPQVEIHVKDEAFFKKIIRYGDIGLGESYFLGYFETPNLVALLTWFVDNGSLLPKFQESKVSSIFFEWARVFSAFLHKMKKNTKTGSKKNIKAHYDVSNEFYKLWLDPTMTYSSAYFKEGMNLQEAQEKKYQEMCNKINLTKDDHILEIGTGWGGFSIYAATTYGCKVTTVTISDEQYAYAKEKVVALGLDKLIDVRLQDYRDITGTYDHIVSIEMMEALGNEYVEPYISTCSTLVKSGGTVAYQVITMPDHHFEQYLANQDYIQKHIFPGAELLSIGHMKTAAKNTGVLSFNKIEYFGQSYAKTLQLWRKKFTKEYAAIEKLGFDEAFIKKWFYYFVYCEVGFATEYINVAQISFTKT